jgi:hypothetical protein
MLAKKNRNKDHPYKSNKVISRKIIGATKILK